MGLKSGSRDAGLDESEDDGEQPVKQETEEFQKDDETPMESSPPESTDASSKSVTTAETDSQRPTMESIPYKLRRNKVNEGREQVSYFVQEEITEAVDDFQDTLKEILGEDVYKSDYREAATVVAQRNPELVAEVLQEWGYDLDAA